jgi:hypothetical protein
MIQLTISDVDYCPEELDQQLPLVVDLIRQLPGNDRPDYWIAKARIPIRWIHENHEHLVGHLGAGSAYIDGGRRWPSATGSDASIEHLPRLS